MSWDGHVSISGAVVRACGELSLGFDQRLHIYKALVQALRSQEGHPSSHNHPRDPAWTLACLKDLGQAQEYGAEDARYAEPRAWTFRQLLKMGHPAGFSYEKGYVSVAWPKDLPDDITRRIVATRDWIDSMREHGEKGSPLELAMLLRAYVDAGGHKVSDSLRTWFEQEAGCSLEMLLAKEDSGELYPISTF